VNWSSVKDGGWNGWLGLLTVAFIVLKLTGIIEWSWWWVLSPVWISVALAVLLIVISYIIGFIWGSRSK